ncbi:head maturation protease [Pseudomonas phage 201phi2-1]|uniref:Uncharacterized protein n=1 Tax=Pseudomonas phage 201phi2-1 TaxID=198110 RepID=B3FJ68_BP201|nr:head maturation protease [Pseudomonas phage 201phi2-1]ABY63035.1 hypothetical protein 201phi2-1p206 [Pseudomonas phage 201phi2-1]
MEATLTITREGSMYADFLMDSAPVGFEDCLEKSELLRRLHWGQAFAELGEPITDNLIGDPVATLRRIHCLEERNICAHVTMRVMDLSGDHLRAFFKPYGPMADKLRGLWLTNPTGLKAKFRYIQANNDEGDLTVTNIYGIDVIQN